MILHKSHKSFKNATIKLKTKRRRTKKKIDENNRKFNCEKNVRGFMFSFSSVLIFFFHVYFHIMLECVCITHFSHYHFTPVELCLPMRALKCRSPNRANYYKFCECVKWSSMCNNRMLRIRSIPGVFN